MKRRRFYSPNEIAEQVTAKVKKLRATGAPLDFLTFVPDGEPTLDENLGRIIDLVRPLNVPVAVITNGSLLWQADVRRDLMGADWVSLKVDTVREDVWRRINRPHPSLDLSDVLAGLEGFAHAFGGFLATETMLVKGLNDAETTVTETAEFVAALCPRRAYIGVPTRPPSQAWCQPPDEQHVTVAYRLFAERMPDVECLTEELTTGFLSTGDLPSEILAITSVHPMTESALRDLLRSRGATWAAVTGLLERGLLKSVSYRGTAFYIRCLPRGGREDN